jgi:hypothetical protein
MMPSKNERDRGERGRENLKYLRPLEIPTQNLPKWNIKN